MLTDVQIAQNASMLPIKDVAGQIGLSEDDLELYGKYKAKISLETIKKLENNLYEIRSKRALNIQRAIYFQVQGSQYLITNAFTKKTQKTPENEKKIARNRRSRYFNKEDQ